MPLNPDGLTGWRPRRPKKKKPTFGWGFRQGNKRPSSNITPPDSPGDVSVALHQEAAAAAERKRLEDALRREARRKAILNALEKSAQYNEQYGTAVTEGLGQGLALRPGAKTAEKAAREAAIFRKLVEIGTKGGTKDFNKLSDELKKAGFRVKGRRDSAQAQWAALVEATKARQASNAASPNNPVLNTLDPLIAMGVYDDPELKAALEAATGKPLPDKRPPKETPAVDLTGVLWKPQTNQFTGTTRFGLGNATTPEGQIQQATNDLVPFWQRELDDQGNPKFETLADYYAARAKARNPSLWNTFKAGVGDVLSGFADLRARQQNISKATNRHLGLPEWTAGDPLEMLAKPIDEIIFQPYYSSQYSRNRGGDLGEQFGSFFAALNPWATNANETATNTLEKRERLREEGKLLSFGEATFAHKKGEFFTFGATTPEDIASGKSEFTKFPGFVPIIGGKRVSGAGDLALQILGDPLNTVGIAGRGLRKPLDLAAEKGAREGAAALAREIGESGLRAGMSPSHFLKKFGGNQTKNILAAIQQQGREAFLANSNVGKSLMRGVEDMLTQPGVINNADAVQKALPGLSRGIADAIVAAARKDGIEGALSAIKKAMAEGKWSPAITLRRQFFANAAGDLEAVGARGVPILYGPKTLKAPGRVRRYLERIGRGDGTDTAGLRFDNPDVVANNAVERALAHTGETAVDLYARVVQREITGLSPDERLARLWGNAQGDAALEDLIDAAYQQLVKTAGDQGINLATILNSPLAEQMLRRLEVLDAVLDGKATAAGAADLAARQAETILRKGWKVEAAKGSQIAKRAMQFTLGKSKGAQSPVFVPSVGTARLDEATSLRLGIRNRVKELTHQLKFLHQLPEVTANDAPIKLAQAAVDKVIAAKRRRLLQLQSGHNPSFWKNKSPAELKLRITALEDDITDLIDNRPLTVTEQRAKTVKELSEERKALKLQAKDIKPLVAMEKQVNAAADKVVGKLGFKKGAIPDTETNRLFIHARIVSYFPQGELQDSLLRELDEVAKLSGKDSAKLANFTKRVEALVANPEALDEAARMADNLVQRAADGMPSPAAKRGVIEAAKAKGARALLSLDESLPSGGIRWEESPNKGMQKVYRAQDSDRWLASLGFDPGTRQAFVNAMLQANDESEGFVLIKEAIATWAEKRGVDPQDFLDEMDRKLSSQRAGLGFLVEDVTVEPRLFGREKVVSSQMSREVHTAAQRIKQLPIISRQEAEQMARRILAREGKFSAKASLTFRAGIKPITVTAKKVHTFWKLAVVTNMQFAIPLGIYGFAAEDGSLTDRLKGGAQGFAFGGAFGGVRYIARLGIIEERLVRYNFDRSFHPKEWIPGISKWQAKAGIDLPARTADDVAPMAGKYLANRILTSADNSVMEALTQKNPRFLDSWARQVNYQLQPEVYDVDRLFLMGKAGILTPEQAERAVREYLDTEAGQLFLNRMKGALAGPKNADELIERYKTFIDAVTTPDLARLRLEVGDVPRAAFKDELKHGMAPEAIHAYRTWVIPKNFKDAASTWRQLMAKLVMEGPTRTLNRRPLHNWIYHDEYKRLVKNGVDADEAQEIAEEVAVRRTNETMFNLSDESKFASKADFVFPFQQPREEMLRVYGKLAVRNPSKTFKWGRLAALSFNNGVNNGVFYQDPISDEWYMNVPGSSFISRALTGHDIPFKFKVRDLMFVFQGFQGAPTLTDSSDIVTGLVNSIAPRPGGPFWASGVRMALNSFPDFAAGFEKSWWYDKLLPYGSTGYMFRPEMRRAFYSIMFSPAPWEFASKFEQENELNRWSIRMTQELIYEHLLENPGDVDWLPDPKDVEKATKDFFRLWAGFGSVFPAGTQPKFKFQDWRDDLVEQYKSRFAEDEWFKQMLVDHPEMAAFVQSSTEYTDSDFDTFKAWVNGREEENNNFFRDFVLHHKRYLSLDRFMGSIKEAQKTSQMWQDYGNTMALGGSVTERERALEELQGKYPQLSKALHNSYFQLKDLTSILKNYPKWAQPAALDRWRKQYDVSHGEFLRLQAQAAGFKVNLFQEGRDTRDVWTDIKKNYLDKHLDPMPYINSLPVAEQYRAAQGFLDRINYDWFADAGRFGDDHEREPSEVLNEWNRWKAFQRNLLGQHPDLVESLSGINYDGTPRSRSPFEQKATKFQDSVRKTLDALHAQVTPIEDAMKEAAEAKQWSLYYSLKDRRTQLYDKIRETKNQAYKAIPNLDLIQKEIKAYATLTDPNASKDDKAKAARVIAQWQAKYADVPGWQFIPTDEQLSFMSKPDDIQQAYIDNLIDNLSKDPAKYEKGKLFWEWLSDFQKELLEKNLPTDMVDSWKTQDPDADYSGGRSGRGRGRRGRGGGNSELSFVFGLFKEYNRRPAGDPPAGYKEYLELPQSPGVRAEFLRQHPEVAEWVKLGPLANMPELYRYLSINIMVKYGKWSGEERSIEDITELAWAREQLSRWSNRGDAKRPDTYDIWLAMPSGPEKAAYLAAHPEIGEWLRLGPMSNMPDNYREVVRDIMVRYGEWSNEQDALGGILNEYFKLPSYARDQFLQAHPEITAYWAALRSPEEQRMFDLTNRYFAIPDGSARRMFLATYPELQRHFVDQREKRYERFLNQVALFMGGNPELFEQYLERQSDILAELLRRYAQPSLLREIPKMKDPEVPKRQRTRTTG